MIRYRKYKTLETVMPVRGKLSSIYKSSRNKGIRAYGDRWYDHLYLVLPAAAIIRMVLTILMITEVAGKDYVSQIEKVPLVNLDIRTYTKECNIPTERRDLDVLLSEKHFISPLTVESSFLPVSATRIVDEGKMAVNSDFNIDSVSRLLKIYYQTGKLEVGPAKLPVK